MQGWRQGNWSALGTGKESASYWQGQRVREHQSSKTSIPSDGTPILRRPCARAPKVSLAR